MNTTTDATVTIEAPYGGWVVEFTHDREVLGPREALEVARRAGHTGKVEGARRISRREWTLYLGDLA